MTKPTGGESHFGHSLMNLSVVEMEKKIQDFDICFSLSSDTMLTCSFRIYLKKIFTKVEKVKQDGCKIFK